MKTLTLHSEIGTDGIMRLEVPVGLPAGRAEVVLVVHPEDAAWFPQKTKGAGRSSTNPHRPRREYGNRT